MNTHSNEKVIFEKSDIASSNNLQDVTFSNTQTEEYTIADIKMIQAYGVPLLNSDGSQRLDLWSSIWERVTRLKGSLYTLPGGSVAKEFISLYNQEVSEFANGKKKSESFICFPSLVLQKDKHIKRTKDIRILLKRRMRMWQDGLFRELIKEAEDCDRKLPQSSGKMSEDQEAKIFSSLILQGRMREAVRFITERQGGGVMSPDEDAGKPAGKNVFEVLESKHPQQRVPNEEDFICCEDLPPFIDIEVTNSHVEQAAKKLSGSAGISGFDSHQMQKILLRHGKHSENLRESFAKAATKLANSIVEWDDIRALKAKRLIALNKMPEVRPVGIGESADRCFEKIMTLITGSDVMEICGSDQLYSGVKSGIEGAIHAISQKFNEHSDEGWGLLLTDAENAFNSISRPVFLWNARIYWTRGSRFLFNSYRGYAILALRSSSQVHYLFSKEGCTQGSGCAMQAYAIGILPLIRKLKKPDKWTQNWYADDGSCLSDFDKLIEWLKLLIIEGPKHGYYNEVSKMILVVAPQFVDRAKERFKEFGVQVLTGHRLLGGFIGSESEKSSWVLKKIDAWTQYIQKISKVAKYDPQSAFIAVSKSLQNEWSFIQRVINVDDNLFGSLKDQICQNLLPNICGFEINNLDANLMLRPARFGGIGIRNPVKSAVSAFKTSSESTSILKDAIISGLPLDIYLHQRHAKVTANKYRMEDDRENASEVENLIQNMPEEIQENKIQ